MSTVAKSHEILCYLQHIMRQRLFYLISSVFIFLILLVMISCTSETNSEDSGMIKIALREAGNQLLLQQQDSTSIISPVLQLESGNYVLSFQKQLSFEPNGLVTVIDSSFSRASLSQNYRVEVMQCDNNEVAYSYEMNVEEERTIIPCAGRYLPIDCYTIEVTFINKPNRLLNKTTIGVALILGFLLFLFRYYYIQKKQHTNISEDKNTNYSEIGSFHFYPEQNKLVKAATEISLSKKECELLEIFVAHPNQIIKRDELTKKVWEDNGVIVGRSLDTYISKLRKKLKDDDTIKLTNVHGVGYKLEMN